MRALPGGAEPTPPQRKEITDALLALRDGSPEALERLTRLVYDDLKRVAHRQLASERTGVRTDTEALVHAAFLRVVDQTRVQWVDRAHFFAVAARMMRRLLIDRIRLYKALRHGGGLARVPFDAPEVEAVAAAARADELDALDAALERLALLDQRLARVVDLRFFGGYTEEQTAEILGVTRRTVARDWVKARGWLFGQLRPHVS